MQEHNAGMTSGNAEDLGLTGVERAKAIADDELERMERDAGPLASEGLADAMRAEVDAGVHTMDTVDAAYDARAVAEARHAHPDRSARPDLERIIASNGYNAVRNAILVAPQTVGAIDLDVFDAAIDYATRAIARMRFDTANDPAVRAEAIRNAEYELTVLRATRKFRRDLQTLDERQSARDRLTA